ncbi:MAG: LacI family DNA-binding transcriptional regulator [Pseudobacter sp.]|uniref:LacI family DNA-binding transcriptional regulator n=1 Tax=Pseudobacter sp. TaxID=2045420 RepID=UPI003F7EBABB
MESRKTTISDIARKLKISKSTVSRALSNHASIGLRTRTRVQELATELNYEPDQTAINFKQRKKLLLGVVLPSISHEFFASIVSGIEDIAYSKNYTLLLGQSRDDEGREKRIVETMKDHRVDGMLISISKNTTNYEHFELLRRNKIPVVFFDRIPAMNNIHYIASQLESGMTEAVNFLIKKGHKHIALINGPEHMPASKERMQGFSNALKKKRIRPNPRYLVHTDLTKEGNTAATQELLNLKNRPDAIIAFNDYVAMDAIQHARQAKVKINKDICFISFANEAICDYMEHPPMASIEQFPYQQGEKATETLLQLLQNTDADGDTSEPHYHNILLPSQLVVRISK